MRVQWCWYARNVEWARKILISFFSCRRYWDPRMQWSQPTFPWTWLAYWGEIFFLIRNFLLIFIETPCCLSRHWRDMWFIVLDPHQPASAQTLPWRRKIRHRNWARNILTLQRWYYNDDTIKIYNVIAANQAGSFGNRYFASMHKYKQQPTNVGSCCESQGVRTWGSLPEFLYLFLFFLLLFFRFRCGWYCEIFIFVEWIIYWYLYEWAWNNEEILISLIYVCCIYDHLGLPK